MVKLAQRYAKATQSSNLKSDDYHFDTDKLAAVALSGGAGFGNLLFRVKFANDATSYVRLAEEWEWEVKKRAALAGWPLHVKEAAVAKAALKYWLNDLCPVCGGKGVRKMEFVDILSDDPCDTCEGSGKRPIEADPRIHSHVAAMVLVLEAMTITAGSNAMRKLAADMDLS
jgi:DnaJ-class molecular chaperone